MVDYKTDIGFVDTHAKSDGSDNDIDLFHEELVLIVLAGLAIETGMVRQCLDAVNSKGLRQFFHFFTAQSINDARLARIGLYIFNNV